MIKRPILIACIGYIIGIIYGLYIKSIVHFLFVCLIIIFSFKFINKKMRKYMKVLIPLKAIIIFIIAFIISYVNLKILNQKYENIYKFNNLIKITGIVENVETREYSNKYVLKLKTINNKKSSFRIILNAKQDLEIGDYISLEANYIEPDGARNYKGFSYKEYLKQKKIIGTIEPINEIMVLKKNKIDLVSNLSNKLKKLILDESGKNLGAENSSIFVGILLGDKTNISKDVLSNFKQSSMMHILAVSGAHVSYVILFFSIVFKRISKKKYVIFLILILLFFMILTNFTSSVVRACIMAILILISKLVHEKTDTYTNLSLACLILLIDNPFNLLNIGFQLSFLGTLGIILFNPIINNLMEKIYKFKTTSSFKKYLLNAIIISISVQIIIFPIIALNFNIITLNFIISGIISVPIFAAIMIIGILTFMLFPIRVYIFKILNIFIYLLNFSSKFISSIPFTTIDITTPNILYILIYYFVLIIVLFFNSNILHRIIKNDFKLKNILKKIIILFLIITIMIKLFQFAMPKRLRIYFIDVGQGDSCLIVTPHNNTILIDGGGSSGDNYDLGESVLVPYLLDRGVKNIDYVIVSHFDTDHVGRIIYSN